MFLGLKEMRREGKKKQFIFTSYVKLVKEKKIDKLMKIKKYHFNIMIKMVIRKQTNQS